MEFLPKEILSEEINPCLPNKTVGKLALTSKYNLENKLFLYDKTTILFTPPKWIEKAIHVTCISVGDLSEYTSVRVVELEMDRYSFGAFPRRFPPNVCSAIINVQPYPYPTYPKKAFPLPLDLSHIPNSVKSLYIKSSDLEVVGIPIVENLKLTGVRSAEIPKSVKNLSLEKCNIRIPDTVTSLSLGLNFPEEFDIPSSVKFLELIYPTKELLKKIPRELNGLCIFGRIKIKNLPPYIFYTRISPSEHRVFVGAGPPVKWHEIIKILGTAVSGKQ